MCGAAWIWKLIALTFIARISYWPKWIRWPNISALVMTLPFGFLDERYPVFERAPPLSYYSRGRRLCKAQSLVFSPAGVQCGGEIPWARPTANLGSQCPYCLIWRRMVSHTISCIIPSFGIGKFRKEHCLGETGFPNKPFEYLVWNDPPRPVLPESMRPVKMISSVNRILNLKPFSLVGKLPKSPKKIAFCPISVFRFLDQFRKFHKIAESTKGPHWQDVSILLRQSRRRNKRLGYQIQ